MVIIAEYNMYPTNQEILESHEIIYIYFKVIICINVVYILQ